MQDGHCLSVCLSVTEDIDPITETGKTDEMMVVAGGDGDDDDDTVNAGELLCCMRRDRPPPSFNDCLHVNLWDGKQVIRARQIVVVAYRDDGYRRVSL